ncbi:MAG: photosystem P840 reaction-center cytochrome c-551 [Deltaproteobacteria bacterium]|nr:photosystem P840 reaction-center cytochrome c-551 [Deltaproteobacteria bacterium]
MRKHSLVLCALFVLMLSLALGCSKSEAPKPEAPPVPAAASAPAPAPQASETAAPASAPAAGGAVAEGKVLFEQKCSVCHELTRATDRKETKEDWTRLVKEMQGKKSGWISDAEAAKIVDFLAAEHGKK